MFKRRAGEPSPPLKMVLTILMVIVAAAFLAPTVWITANALRPQQEIFTHASSLSPNTFIPVEWTIQHFITVLTGPFALALANSLIIAVVTVVLGLLVSAAAAFALSTLRVPGKAVVFAFIVISFLVPFDALAVPLSATFRQIGLDNTYTGLILPGLGHGLAIFLFKQFFDNLPIELLEAAKVDGASQAQTLFRIYLPITKPAMIGAGIILFMFQWQAYLWPLLVGTESKMYVGAIAIARMFGEYSTDYGALFAGSFLLALVPALILLIFQKQFVSSVASTGLKD